MNAARRDKRRRDWPRGLYEPRPGYYVFRDPRTGKSYAIGKVPYAHARAEAIAANALIAGITPSLVERLQGAAQTVGELLDQMPASTKPNTAKTWRTLDKRIRAALGDMPCSALQVRHCAELIEAVEAEEGKARTAEALRSRLIAVCARGQQLGWMESNPATPTRRPTVTVKRGRLTLETYRLIEAKATEVNEWLLPAMRLAILTGADVSTVAGLKRSDIRDDLLIYTRGKTGITIGVPLDLRLDALGLSLRDVVTQRTGVLSRYLVHHVRSWGNAPAGAAVSKGRISHAFAEARRLAGLDGDDAPTFHELRSLAKRLHDAQGDVDTEALLGHRTKRVAALYADPRGAEVVRVRVKRA